MRKNAIALLTFFVVLAIVPARAQESRYSFVRYDANRLHGDSTSATFAHFVQRWNAVTQSGKGNIHIVHIGSSHVQGGTFPHQVRMNLLRRNPTLVGPRGMIFPYSAAAKCNNPADYRVHCVEKVELCRNVYKEPQVELGLCGIAVTAHDSTTTIALVRNEYQADFTVSRLVVLGYSPDGVVPRLDVDGQLMMPHSCNNALRSFTFVLPHSVDSLAIVLPCDSAQQFHLTGVYLDNDRSGVSYHSIGVNGAALNDYLRCPWLTRDLSMLQPDMVIFGIGINDAAQPDFDSAVFHAEYRRLVDSVRSVNPRCALLFITNNDSYKSSGRGRRKKYVVNPQGEVVRQVFYRLAEETDGVVWDQFEVMGGLKSMMQWQKAGLAQRDKVHFTREGYQLIGDLFSDALLKAIERKQP